MQTSEVLNRAADLIEERGWVQGSGWFPTPDYTGPLCMEGACKVAAGGRHQPTLDALSEHLTSTRPEHINPFSDRVIPFTWNDWPGTTAAEVVEVLRAVSLIEAAKENADVREVVPA